MPAVRPHRSSWRARAALSLLALLVACDARDAAPPAPPSSTADADPPLVPRAIDLVPDGPGRVRVLLRFSAGADRTLVDTLLATLGARVAYRYRLLPDLVAVRALPDSALEALARVPGVAALLPDRLLRTQLAQSRAAMNATPAALAGFSDGRGVRVCVLDTGLNKTHPAFAGALVAERDFVNGDNDATDDQGHGTNVAGIIASRDATWGGVAPGASLVVGKVLSASGSGSDADIIAAIEWCTLDADADVINMSLGGGLFAGTCDDDSLARAVNASVDAGVVNVIAAGNDGQASAISSPACARRALTIAAVYDAVRADTSWCLASNIFGTCTLSCTDTNITADTWTCFSNRALKIDVAAPGCEITAPHYIGTGVSGMCGTSQATPHVAGLVARLLGARPELGPNDVRAFLWNNAVDRGPSGFDVSFGHGRVDARATLADDTAVTCTRAADCDDADPCTRDVCQDGFCARRPLCDDADATTADTCAGGVCTHTPLTADDARSCTTDTLDACLGPRYSPTTPACYDTCAEALPLPIGVTITGSTTGATNSIASNCPGAGTPGANVVYRVRLHPAQPVTFRVTATATWDPALYLLASASANACDTTRCVGGIDTTGTGIGQVETMSNVRVPVEGWYYLVVDGATTTTGSFVLVTSASCDPEDDGRPCDDGNACTKRDVCVAGACVAGPSDVDCTSGDECDDDDPCNGVETCVNELCREGTPPTCDDANPCTSDACLPGVGCTTTAVPDGAPCPDATLCNGAEACRAGVCGDGPDLACDDGNPCTSDSCDPLLGCRTTVLPAGTSCADADVCDGAEVCAAGVCVDGPDLDCADGDPCTTDACDPALGCTTHDAPDGTTCSDGDACTAGDACQAGLCQPGVDTCRVPQLVFAVREATTLGELRVDDEDLVRFDLGQGRHALYFDGSDVGLGQTAIAALAYHPSGDLVLAFTDPVNLPGLAGGPAGDLVEPHDLVRFTPSHLGADTAGTFTFLFDGSAVGLSQPDERIDALAYLADGTLVLSTTGTASVAGLLASPHDLLRFSPTALGAATSGTWSLYFDGSDVGLAQLSENLDAVSVLADGTLLLSLSGNTITNDLDATDPDVLAYTPSTSGAQTSGAFADYRSGAALGLDVGLSALEWRMLEP